MPRRNWLAWPTRLVAGGTVLVDAASESKFIVHCQRLAGLAGGLAIGVAALVLAAWLFNIAALKGLMIGTATMKPWTAIGLSLAGMALGLLAKANSHEADRGEWHTRRQGLVCAALTALIGGATLAECLTRTDFGFDGWLFPNALAASHLANPGRMAGATALGLLLLGAALWCQLSGAQWSVLTGQALALLVLVIGGLAIEGYIFDVRALYSLAPYASMALHTAFLLALLAAGVLAANPDRGVMARFSSAGLGGAVMRRSLPWIILLPFVMGWLRWRGELAGWYGTAFGLAIFIAANTVVLASLVWFSAQRLNTLDAKRGLADKARQENAARLAGIINSAMDAIITVDEQQKIVLFNPSSERMFQWSAAEVMGQALDRLIPQRFREGHAAHVQGFGQTGVTRRKMGGLGATHGLRRDGTEFPIEASISQIEIGGNKLFTVILRDISERQQAEAMQTQFAAIIESSDDAIISKRLDESITSWNPAAERIFGYTKAEAVGQPMLILFPPENVNEESEILGKIRQGQGVEHYETQRLRKDGVRIEVSVTVSPLRDSQGQIIGASKIARDITERKRAELELRASETRYRTLFEYAPDGIVIADSKSTYIDANSSICRMLGYTREEFIGLNAADIVAETESRHVEAALNEIMTQSDHHREWQFRRKDASVFAAEVLATTMPDGNLLGVIRDITERKQAEAKLRASLSETGEFKAALDEHLIVTMTDPSGKITYVNDKFCAISQYSREELIGQDHRITNSGHHSRDFFRGLWATIEIGRAWHGEIKNKAKDGSFYWVDATIVPFLNDQYMPRQYMAIHTDISTRKEAEDTIRRLYTELEERVQERTKQLEAANKELEAFSYSVSHDLRAPLRAVDGFSQAVLEDYGAQLPEEGRHQLQTVRAGAQKMGALIDDLLTFSRLSRLPLTKRTIDMDKLVRDTLADMNHHQNGRQLEIRVGELPPALGDPALLKQVWINLLSNACKYSRKRARAVVEVGCTRQDGENVYFVRDNGTGFDMRYVGKLFGVFQRFHRAEDYEGTGVGLAIVQRVIHRHGGRIWAEAAVDQGATFYFTLKEEAES